MLFNIVKKYNFLIVIFFCNFSFFSGVQSPLNFVYQSCQQKNITIILLGTLYYKCTNCHPITMLIPFHSCNWKRVVMFRADQSAQPRFAHAANSRSSPRSESVEFIHLYVHMRCTLGHKINTSSHNHQQHQQRHA